MNYEYIPQGVCSRKITFDIKNGIITNVSFQGGCNGNTKGIAALVEGMDVNEVIRRLEGTRCGFKPTSCPDLMRRLCLAFRFAPAFTLPKAIRALPRFNRGILVRYLD